MTRLFQQLRKITLPLLLRELIEQSARRRTYIIRIVYVTLFFLACLSVILPEYSSRGSSPLGMLGIGKNAFMYIIAWQFAGIYLFLPALTCSVLTVEKERNTIGLLFLTRLGPWTIVVEKLLSRLLPMFYLLLCSLPLLAFTISLGGVNWVDMLTAVTYLSLTAFQVCSIGVACSAFFRTTTGALLACYAVLFLVIFGLPMSDWLLFSGALRDGINGFLQAWYGQSAARANPFMYMYGEVILFCMFGFAQFIIRMEQGARFTPDTMMTILTTIPLIVSALLPIPIARFFLIRRAFVSPKNLALVVLRWIDRVFHRLNNNPLTRGRVLLDESHTEPDFSPIAWRETHKRSLGRTVYLVRIFLALEIPVLMIILGMIFRTTGGSGGMEYVLNMTTLLVWMVVALLVTVTSAALISGERGRQTMDILLALPVTGRTIILDKIAGVRRIIFVSAIPLVTSIIFEAWWRDVVGSYGYSSVQDRYIWWNYLLTALSMVAVYLPLLCWLSLYIGLKTKSPTRATLTALIVIAAWCILPILGVIAWWEIFIQRPGQMREYMMLMQLSPLGLLLQSELDSLARMSEVPLLPMFLNVFFYGMCWLLIRAHVLRSADKLLGRSEPTDRIVVARPNLKATEPLAQASPG